MKKVVAFVLMITMFFISTGPVFADSQASDNRIYDETIGDYLTLNIVTSNEVESRVQALDSKNNVIYDYTYNVYGNYFYSHTTGEKEFLSDEILETSTSTNLMLTKSSNSLPNLCNGADSGEFSIPIKVITGGVLVSSAVIITKLSALIVAKTAISLATLEKISAFSITAVAADIINTINTGDWGRSAHFTMTFKCKEMCDFDPFEPSGKVCFYGQQLDSIDYVGTY